MPASTCRAMDCNYEKKKKKNCPASQNNSIKREHTFDKFVKGNFLDSLRPKHSLLARVSVKNICGFEGFLQKMN